jgi:hypothetical protein
LAFSFPLILGMRAHDNQWNGAEIATEVFPMVSCPFLPKKCTSRGKNTSKICAVENPSLRRW